jgi:hypothetical protein
MSLGGARVPTPPARPAYFDQPTVPRAVESAAALAPILRTKKLAGAARALDLCCPKSHRVATVYRVPERRLVLVRYLRIVRSRMTDQHAKAAGHWAVTSDAEAAGGARPQTWGIHNEKLIVTDWLDGETAVTHRGRVQLACPSCSHRAAMPLDDLRDAVPPTGKARRVVPSS